MYVKVKGITKSSQEEKVVLVESRVEFGLEILSLVEQGICVELEEVTTLREDFDVVIKSSEIEKAYAWLIKENPNDSD